MILKDPKDAIGHKIRWCRWENNKSFFVESIDTYYGKIRGILHDTKGKNPYTYNLVKGITTGEIMTDRWYIINWNPYKLNDELFEI